MIIHYFRYFDDILLIIDSNHTSLQAVLTDFNSIHPNLHFTAETEQNNTIHYLNISIKTTAHHIKIAVYSKPTFTYTITALSSIRPTQHKYVAVR